MKRTLLYLTTLATLAACDNNQSTPDNPFNNLEDAFVNFDKDVGVKDAAPMLDVSSSKDFSLPFDMSSQDVPISPDLNTSDTLPDNSLPRDATLEDTLLPDASGQSPFNLRELHSFAHVAHHQENHHNSRLASSPRGALLASNIDGEGAKMILFDERDVLLRPTFIGQDFFAYDATSLTLNDQQLVAFVGSELGQSLQILTTLQQISPTLENNPQYLGRTNAVLTVNHNLIYAGVANTRALITLQDLRADPQEPQVHEVDLGEGEIHDLLFVGAAAYAVGETPQGAVLWSHFENFYDQQLPGTIAHSLDANVDQTQVCIAGATQRGGFVSRHNAQTGEELWSHQTPSPMYGVVTANQHDQNCLVVGGDNLESFAALYNEQGEQAQIPSLPDHVFTSILTQDNSYLVSARVHDDVCPTQDPCHDAIYTLEVDQ